MNVLARRAGPWLLFLGFLPQCPCYAQLLAQSGLSFRNFQITPASGTVVFDDPSFWIAQAVASESNLSGNSDVQFGVSAFTAFASQFGISSATADPLALSELARSRVSIPAGVEAFSLATGQSLLDGTFNYFRITDGVSTGPVGVTFSGDIAGALAVSTDNLGLIATTETVFALDLYDGTVDPLGFLVPDSILFRRDILSIGPNASLASAFATTLNASRTLQFDTLYFLIIAADSESLGLTAVPESSHYGVAAFALVLLKAVVRRRKSVPGSAPVTSG